jgi:hypothetical protein
MITGFPSEMTSSLPIGNAWIDIMIKGHTLLVTPKDVFPWVKVTAESVTAFLWPFSCEYSVIGPSKRDRDSG